MTYEARIDRFKVIRRIGGGGSGEVSLAFDPDNNRDVALKVVHGGVGDRAEMLEAEKRGAEIQEQLSREVLQIARIYETWQVGNTFYIVMEYVRGTDLADLLADPLPQQRAVFLAIQLCEILDACSRVSLSGRGNRDRVVHGDIKPQNIRIEDGDQVRLLDFGVAKSVSLTRQYTGNVFGSIPYLSPERLAENRVSAQSDLWSVGVVLYQMLTGKLPYDADSEEALKARVQRGGLPQPPSPLLSPQLRQILSRCLQPNPSQRYPDAVSLKEALESVGDEVVEAAQERGTETKRTVDSPPEPAPQTLWENVSPAAPFQHARPSFWERARTRFSRESRAALQQIQERVRRMGSVPSQAHQFSNAIEHLQSDIEKTSRQLRISRDQVEQYRERTEQLEKLADPLAAAIREAGQIQQEVHRLETGIQILADPGTRSWFESRSRGWIADLQKIGTAVRRPTELEDDRDQVKKLREDVRLHAEVLSALEEAEWTLSLLGESAQTKALAEELPTLRDQLRKQGASEGWLEHTQNLVLPLRPATKQAKNPREEIQKLSPLLAELRDWAKLSGGLKQDVALLEQRYRSLGPGAKLAEVEGLTRDANGLRERFLRQSQEQCDAKLAELDQRVKILASAAGPLPFLEFLEERLRALKRHRIEAPQNLPDWMCELEEASDLFRTTAKNQESALEQGLVQQVEHLRERLRVLQGMPLSAAAREEANNLMDEMRELAPTAGGGQVLPRSHRAREVEKRIEELQLQALEDRQGLHRQREVLRGLNDELQAEAQQIGIELPDLSQRIDEIGEGAQQPSLEAARQAADSLSAELDALRLQFEEQCRKILGERMSEILAVSEALQRIGRSFSPPVLAALASGASPKEAALAVAAGLELTRIARDAAEQAFQTQEELLQRARSVLELDHKNVLGPDERKTAEARLTEIEKELADEGQDLIGRLERRAKLIEACEPLLSRLHQDERRARERLEALKQRLQRPEAFDLRRFYPELTEQIVGLVYGVPPNPWQWQAVEEQLTEAEIRLARVEDHSLRLAAEELSRAVQDLWPGEGDPNDALFADLSRFPREALPPWPVRRKVLEAHKRQQQARGSRT